MEHPLPTSARFKSSLDASWKEGIAASVMIAITDYYLIPLGLFLGATAAQIGWLVAIPHFLGAAAQLVAVNLLRLVGNRRLQFLVQGAFLQASTLVPVALLPLIRVPHRVAVLIVCVALFRITGNLVGTVWGSLVSSYLPPERRGKYFGWRSQVTGLAGVVSMLAGGLALFLLKPFSTAWAFCLIFTATALARFISVRLMAQMEDIPLAHSKETSFTFAQFLARFRESNFVKFVLFVASLTFATTLASPYFSVFMLQELEFSYLTYMVVHLATVLASLVAFPLWGRHADIVGNAKVLRLTGLYIPFIPLLWMVSAYVPYLIVVECVAGFMWGGFNLCAVNFIYDAVTEEKRTRCLSYFNLINGTAIFVGAFLGGYAADHLPALAGSRFYTLFVVSALLRIALYLWFARQFQEVRATTRRVSSTELFFSVVGLRPFLGRPRQWPTLPFVKKPKQ